MNCLWITKEIQTWLRHTSQKHISGLLLQLESEDAQISWQDRVSYSVSFICFFFSPIVCVDLGFFMYLPILSDFLESGYSRDDEHMKSLTHLSHTQNNSLTSNLILGADKIVKVTLVKWVLQTSRWGMALTFTVWQETLVWWCCLSLRKHIFATKLSLLRNIWSKYGKFVVEGPDLRSPNIKKKKMKLLIWCSSAVAQAYKCSSVT